MGLRNILGIIIILILLFILYLVLFVIDKEFDSGPVYKYSDIKKNLKTGDIILFSCQYHGSFIAQMEYILRTKLLGSMWGHAGIVLKGSNGKIYIVESVGNDQLGYQKARYLNNLNKGGVRIINLDTLFKYYKLYKGIYAVKFISKEIPNDKFIRMLGKYKDMIYRYPRTIILMAVTDILLSKYLANKIATRCSDNQTFCTEFLHDFYYHCGVLKSYPSKLFWPHLITSDVFGKLEKVKFSDPFVFTINEKT